MGLLRKYNTRPCSPTRPNVSFYLSLLASLGFPSLHRLLSRLPTRPKSRFVTSCKTFPVGLLIRLLLRSPSEPIGTARFTSGSFQTRVVGTVASFTATTSGCTTPVGILGLCSLDCAQVKELLLQGCHERCRLTSSAV